MVHHDDRLDGQFAALADPNRRAILEHLVAGEATISQLAAPLGITLTGLKKHVALLESVGLVATEKVGRERRCRLGDHELDGALQWIASYRAHLGARIDRFADLIEHDTNGAPT